MEDNIIINFPKILYAFLLLLPIISSTELKYLEIILFPSHRMHIQFVLAFETRFALSYNVNIENYIARIGKIPYSTKNITNIILLCVLCGAMNVSRMHFAWLNGWRKRRAAPASNVTSVCVCVGAKKQTN